VFEADLSPFESTQSELAEMLAALAAERAELQLEVETYTWDVLPKALRRRSLVEAISEELAWTRRQWA
jgi:hypothetical protein